MTQTLTKLFIELALAAGYTITLYDYSGAKIKTTGFADDVLKQCNKHLTHNSVCNLDILSSDKLVACITMYPEK